MPGRGGYSDQRASRRVLAALWDVFAQSRLSYPAMRFTAIAALLYERRDWPSGLDPEEPAIAGEIDPRTRTQMNVTWSAAAGLSLIAPLQAAIFASLQSTAAMDADSPGFDPAP